ncbi:hypothetical protein [Inediibacterium massiliense]|nr:hypothetical protein [Inediibacterium massiliense]
MTCIDNYKDLCIEIETQQFIVDDIENFIRTGVSRKYCMYR